MEYIFIIRPHTKFQPSSSRRSHREKKRGHPTYIQHPPLMNYCKFCCGQKIKNLSKTWHIGGFALLAGFECISSLVRIYRSQQIFLREMTETAIYVQAIYDFEPEDANELGFSKGKDFYLFSVMSNPRNDPVMLSWTYRRILFWGIQVEK